MSTFKQLCNFSSVGVCNVNKRTRGVDSLCFFALSGAAVGVLRFEKSGMGLWASGSGD